MKFAVAIAAGLLYSYGDGVARLAYFALFPLLSYCTRKEGALAALLFYSCVFFPLINLLSIAGVDPLDVGLIYGASVLFYSVIVGLLFSAAPRFMYVAIALVLLTGVLVLSPLEVISFGFPIWTCGLLFPDTGLVGIGSLVLFIAGLASIANISDRNFVWGVILCGVSLSATSNYFEYSTPHVSANIDALSTTQKPRLDRTVLVMRTAMLNKQARASTFPTVIFPESSFGEWTGSDNYRDFFKPENTVLAGSYIYTSEGKRHIVGDYTANTILYEQRRALPSLVQPVDEPPVIDGFGPSVVTIGTERVALFVCWESLLPSVVIESFVSSPEYGVLLANTYWSESYSVDSLLSDHFVGWARLFGVPSLVAVNTNG